MADRSLRACRMEELGPGLDPHRGQPAARCEADAPRLVVEAEAVLARAVGGETQDQIPELEGDRPRGPVGEHALLFQASQEALRQIAVPGKVEGVDPRGELLGHERPSRAVHPQICDYRDRGRLVGRTHRVVSGGFRSARGVQEVLELVAPGPLEVELIDSQRCSSGWDPKRARKRRICGRSSPGATRLPRGRRIRRPCARPPRTR